MKKILISLFATLVSLTCLAVEASDTTRVLCIGNSFTFVGVAHEKLAEIALSQGHYLDLKAAYVGGYTFRRHLVDLKTIKAIEVFNNPYDCVFLQNQSQVNALYARDPKQHREALKDAVQLTGRVREYSPEARIWMESTWSYEAFDCGSFGTLEEFDRMLLKGTKAFAKAAHTLVSPIGSAFAVARSERPDINLYGDDLKHQSDYGSYLKACVNYLLIFGEKFHGEVSPCGLNPEACAYLRSVAERTILK